MSRTEPTENDSRATIFRELVVFQVKLWVEGFKDIALVPLSLGAAVIDLIFGSPRGRGALYSVMRLGDRFERWVHLYGALEKTPDGAVTSSRSPGTVVNESVGYPGNGSVNASTEATDAEVEAPTS